MNLGLEGVGVLVTGAAGGLGLAICRCFVAEGASVMLSDVDPSRLAKAVSDAGGVGGVAGDVSDPLDAARIIDETVAQLGALDVLVTAAGVYQRTPLDRIQPDEWDRLQAVNVRGTFLSAQAALRVMVPRERGAIVTLGSVAGQLGGVQSGAAYATSKAAVSGMTKSLARHAGPYGVRVNCVNPGYIEAGMGLGTTAEDRERIIAMTPLGRAGMADEVASAVVWLASDAASFVTGAHLDVNGGLLMA